MQYGLYISTSGALNAAYRQDLLTGNLANVNTAGFKPDIPVTRQRDSARAEDSLGFLPSNDLIERLGAGVMAARTRTSFEQGVVRTTGNTLDLAIRGEGFFGLLDGQAGASGGLQLTRDGRFTMDGQGRLVSVVSGMPVAGADGRPITLLPDQAPTVSSDGAIMQGGVEVARLAFVAMPHGAPLTKLPSGHFRAEGGQAAGRRPATGRIEQRAIEESAVDEIRTLMDIEAAARDAQANIGMISYQDRLLDQAINRFGRVV
ncbi:MAG TPA: flagellar hook basal-body protein [Phycisphaerales bacterium]|nr:flagellar hook basal-body protein [Phycisphaerales bacterium]